MMINYSQSISITHHDMDMGNTSTKVRIGNVLIAPSTCRAHNCSTPSLHDRHTTPIPSQSSIHIDG